MKLKDFSADQIVMTLFTLWLLFMGSWILVDKLSGPDPEPKVPVVLINGDPYNSAEVLEVGGNIIRKSIAEYNLLPTKDLLTVIGQMTYEYAGIVDHVCNQKVTPVHACADADELIDEVVELLE